MTSECMNISLPNWSELPTIELYLDQVLIFVNDACRCEGDADDKKLTAAMVNNYVKHGYISRPHKKKYNRGQIARLIAITYLKNAFAIQDIGAALTSMLAEYEASELYDCFVRGMADSDICVSDEMPAEKRTDIAMDVVAYACQTLKLYFRTKQLIRGML